MGLARSRAWSASASATCTRARAAASAGLERSARRSASESASRAGTAPPASRASMRSSIGSWKPTAAAMSPAGSGRGARAWQAASSTRKTRRTGTEGKRCNGFSWDGAGRKDAGTGKTASTHAAHSQAENRPPYTRKTTLRTSSTGEFVRTCGRAGNADAVAETGTGSRQSPETRAAASHSTPAFDLTIEATGAASAMSTHGQESTCSPSSGSPSPSSQQDAHPAATTSNDTWPSGSRHTCTPSTDNAPVRKYAPSASQTRHLSRERRSTGTVHRHGKRRNLTRGRLAGPLRRARPCRGLFAPPPDDPMLLPRARPRRRAGRMQPPEGPARENASDRARERRAEPLPPLVSAALEPGHPTLAARLERIATHGARRGRYTVLGELAQGGMGKVLRAWDEGLAREVAMKVVPRAPAPGSSEDDQADHERRLGRFIDEARITAQLDHPGIVPVYEIGLDEAGGVYF